MQVRPTVTYGISMSSVSRRRRRRGGGGFKKFFTALVVIMFIAALVGFVKFGIIDYFSSSDRAAAYIASGDECLANGDYEGALKDFNKAFDIEDTNADAAAAKGDAYTALKKYSNAEKAYNAALKLDNKCERAYRGFINLNVEKGIASQARAWLEKAEKAGIKFNKGEWSLLSAKAPKLIALSVADDDMNLAEGSIRINDSEVVYTDKASSGKKVIYTGSPSRKFASNGTSVYIYDTGLQQLILADVATGLWYKVTDVYSDGNTSSEYYGNGRFCGCTDTLLYFSEQHSEDDFKTYYLDTDDNSFNTMDKASIKSIISKKDKLYFVSNNSGLYMCDYDGSNLTEICAEIKDKAVVKDSIIFTEPVDGYIVNVWKYDIESGEKKAVANGINVYLINAFYDDFMSYYSIDEDTMLTKLETLEY